MMETVRIDSTFTHERATKVDNLASQAVAKRLHMRELGLTRRYYDSEVLLFVIGEIMMKNEKI